MVRILNRYWYTQKNGIKMHVSEIQQNEDVTNFDSPERESIPAMALFMADNGYHLNNLSDGTFEVVETGEIVTLQKTVR